MIKNFSVAYAGHIDLDNLGLNGTPANDRHYSNKQLVEVYHKTAEIAQLADRAGYDVLWLAEHHFQPEGYECIPNLILLSVYLASQTKRLRFGCGFNILPMWHPLRLAEDFATADILTGGRVIFGIGRGYHTREVETFGSPMLDGAANRELFEETLEVILKAFLQDSFSHQGKYYTVPPPVPYRGYQLKEITLVPRPIHQPVEVWQPIVSASRRGMEFMAKHGIKGVISGMADRDADQVIHTYREIAAEHGREWALGENLSLGFRIYLADSRKEAIKAARPIFEEGLKFAAPLGLTRLTPAQIEAVANPSLHPAMPLPTLEEAVEARVWLCGTPEEVVAYFKELEERYPGLEDINFNLAIGMPKKVALEQMEWSAREVMPAFVGAEH